MKLSSFLRELVRLRWGKVFRLSSTDLSASFHRTATYQFHSSCVTSAFSWEIFFPLISFYLSAFPLRVCVLRKYHVLMCTQVISLARPSSSWKTWKNHLNCLISSMAWHFSLSLFRHVETRAHMSHSRKLSSYIQTCNCSMTSKWAFHLAENFNFKMSWKLLGWELAHKRRTRW